MTTLNQAIFKAVESNDLNKLRILLDLDGADVNIQNEYGDTPLHFASWYDHKEIVAMLLEKDATHEVINVQDIYGNTSLHFASWNDYKEIVAMLLDKNAKIDIQDDDGLTPLDLATKKNHHEIIALINAHIIKQQEATIQELEAKLQQIQDIIKTQ